MSGEDVKSFAVHVSTPYYGGYSTVVPPLPIPNRAVKHSRADGTAQAGE